MFALIRYKYLKGRSRSFNPLVAWPLVMAIIVVLVLVSFGICVMAFRGRTIQYEAATYGLLGMSILIVSFNVSRQSPLNSSFAKELEYLSSLPIPIIYIVLVQLIGWISITVCVIGIVFIGPILAALIDGSFPTPSLFLLLVGMLIYSCFLIFLGGWLHLLALRRRATIAMPIQLATHFFIILGFLLFAPLDFLHIPAEWFSNILAITALPIWPSVWVLLAITGHVLFWMPLLTGTALLMWQTIPRLGRYWEEETALTARHSMYPEYILFGSGWAIAKFFGMEILLNSTIQFIPKVLSLLVGPFIVWSILHVNIHILWIMSIFFASRQLGIPAYNQLTISYEELDRAAIPMTHAEVVRGYCTVFGGIYLPALVSISTFIAFSSPLSFAFFIGLFLGILGVAILALCGWRQVPLSLAFIVLGAIELAASLFI